MGSGLSDATLAVHWPPLFSPPKGWTAETSARAAKPETQIDGHTRPGSTGGADSRRLHRSCLGWWARGGRGWWRRSSGIQPHDTNHHLFSALWNQCMEHCAPIAPRTRSVFIFFEGQKGWAVATIPAGHFLTRTISHKSLAPWRSHRWSNAHPSHGKGKKGDRCLSCGNAVRRGDLSGKPLAEYGIHEAHSVHYERPPYRD